MSWRPVPLDRGDAGVRVDRVLLRHLGDERGVSRSRIQKWIDAGDVMLNDAPVPRASWRVQPGDRLAVSLAPAPIRSRPAAEAMALAIIYEDEHLMAVDKPPGLVVHPSYKHASGTLMNGLLSAARSWPPGSKPSLLGRLDKQTSGLVLVAKRAAVHAALQRAADARRVDKDYLALVWGRPSPARGAIDLALDRDPWDRRRVTVTDRGGQPAVTKYQRLATASPATGVSFAWMRCRLITGRMHQIRVHLKARGWPIVGDAVYGVDAKALAAMHDPATEAARGFGRQALHAWRLEFRHPVTGDALSFTAPVPADLQALAVAVGLPAL